MKTNNDNTKHDDDDDDDDDDDHDDDDDDDDDEYEYRQIRTKTMTITFAAKSTRSLFGHNICFAFHCSADRFIRLHRTITKHDRSQQR